jgi:hypothetical protein
MALLIDSVPLLRGDFAFSSLEGAKPDRLLASDSVS